MKLGMFFGLFLLFMIHQILGVTHQFVDGDEGGYLMLARLTAEGATPHLDLFAPQMPLFFYLYGYWIKIFGTSFEIGRSLSVLFNVLGFFSFYGILNRVFSRHSWPSLFGLVLFVFHLNSFVQSVQIKHYAPSLGLVLASFYFFTRWAEEVLKSRKFQFSHFCLGVFFLMLAANTRSFIVPLIPVVGLWVLVLSGIHFKSLVYSTTWWRGLLGVFISGALPSLGTLWIIFQDYGAFRFNVDQAMLKYFGVWSQMTSQYKLYLLKLMYKQDLQYPILTLLCIGLVGLLVFRFRALKNKVNLSLIFAVVTLFGLCAVILGAVYLKRSPTFSYIQWNYLSPFYLVGASLALGLGHELFGPAKRVFIGVILVFYSSYFLFRGVGEELKINLVEQGHYDNPLRDQSPWAYLRFNHRNYLDGESYRSLSAVQNLAEAIQKLTKPEDKILSWFNGALALSGRNPIKGFEEGVGLNEIFWVSQGPSPEESQRYHVLRFDELLANIKLKTYDWVIVDPYTEKQVRDLLPSHYRLHSKLSQYFIYTKSEVP